MENFKVICKAEAYGWVTDWDKTKIITTTKLFGLIKKTKVVTDDKRVPGPGKDEICIVIDFINEDSQTWYYLAGYPYGKYHSKYFIRLDEFTETQKEIAEKAEKALN